MKLDYADLDAPGLSTIPWAPLGDFRGAALPLEHLTAQAREGLLYRLRAGGRVSYHALHEGALRTLPRRRGWTQLAQRGRPLPPVSWDATPVRGSAGHWPEWWASCDDGAAMLFAAYPLVPFQRVLWTVCQVARTVAHLVSEQLALRSLETTERWCRGEATAKEATAVYEKAQRKAVAKANRAATRGDPYTVADHAEDAVLLASAPYDHWNSYLSPAAVSRSAAAAADEANAAAGERDRRTPARARALERHAELVRGAEHGIPFSEVVRGLLSQRNGHPPG